VSSTRLHREFASARLSDRGVVSARAGYRLLSPLEMERGNIVMRSDRAVNLADVLERSAGKRVLDVGAGSGYYTARIASVATQVVAVEPASHLVQHMRQRFEGCSNVSVFAGTAERLPSTLPREVDVILLALVIDHIPSARLRRVLLDIPKRLRRGGHLIITDLADGVERERPVPCAVFPRRRGDDVRIRLSPHSLSEVAAMLAEAGFSDVVMDLHRFNLSGKSELSPLASVPIVRYVATKGHP